MPLHPLATLIAAQLPDDCPPELLVQAQRTFAQDALAYRASRLSPDDFSERAKDLRLVLRDIANACSESLLEWVYRLDPDNYPTLLAVTAEARKAWAREQAARLLALRPEWGRIAPDIQDSICWEVAEAWHDGLRARVYADLCADYESDVQAESMTQGELFKWLLKQNPHVIARHKDKLSPQNALKFVKQFSAAQWEKIESCYSQTSTEQAARLARAVPTPP